MLSINFLQRLSTAAAAPTGGAAGPGTDVKLLSRKERRAKGVQYTQPQPGQGAVQGAMQGREGGGRGGGGSTTAQIHQQMAEMKRYAPEWSLCH